MKNNNKILLVTGASSDVGVGLIRKVSHNYDTILAHYNRSAASIMALQDEIGDKIIPVQADFSQEGSTRALAEDIISRQLVPTHFVHLPARPLNNVKFTKTTWYTFDMELSTSFRSAVILCQFFVPVMAKRKCGKIIFMLSHNVVNQPPIKYAIPYTSTKYALLGLMKGLSAEYADKSITVNAVSPSMIATKFLSEVPELIIEKNIAESPLKRNLDVGDVITSFEFLLSDGANCVTGQNLAVTGGN
jgi:3-oxoacyl-[acyl-carrier protein] reductase